MPVFYSYESQPEDCGGMLDLTIEADGRPLTGGFIHSNARPAGWLGVPSPSLWYVEAKGQAMTGCAEFTPDDDGDNLLFWTVEAGKVILRVQNRVIVLNVNHIHQPDQPTP